jgi:hypothetical protein
MSNPRGVGAASRALWAKLSAEYSFDDAASLELLAQLARTHDRLCAAQKQVAADGLVLNGRAHPLLQVESQLRRDLLAFCRALRVALPSEV